MRICIISHQYPPSPGTVADYAQTTARHLAAAGHEVHIVTNREPFGTHDLEHSVELWQDGNVTIHRLNLFDPQSRPAATLRFFEIDPAQYPDRDHLWAYTASNMAAAGIAGFVESLHAVERLDVIEVPEQFAAGYYIIRQRNAGRRHAFPPVCLIGHTSTRLGLTSNRDVARLGHEHQRELMQREGYCLEHADALQTPSQSLMRRYEAMHGTRLAAIRKVVPHYFDRADPAAELPPELGQLESFLLAIGQVEPRNGSDVMVRAFARLAADYPALRLVLLSAEPCLNGGVYAESLAHSVRACLDRVVRLAGVPRQQVVAAMQRAAAVVHAAPWDNYPHSVLEAMSAGARCVVSNGGGHAEMIENGSGIVFEADDVESLVDALRRTLGDPDLQQKIGAEAKRRAASITDSATITAAKVELFEQLAEPNRPDPALAGGVGLSATELPGPGLVVIDALGADDKVIPATVDSIADETRQSPSWQVAVLVGEDRAVSTPPEWVEFGPGDSTPWTGLGDSDKVVWVRAGTRFEHGHLARLVELVRNTPHAAGGFAWLRPPNIDTFPYAQDGGFGEFLAEGSLIPPAVCTTASHLRAITELLALDTADARASAVVAVATLSSDAPLLHTGCVEGDYYGPIRLVTAATRRRVLGFADLAGLLPAGVATTHSRAKLAVLERASAGAVEPDSAIAAELEHLRAIRDEHARLKQHWAVRALRSAKVFSLLRRLLPGSKKYLGTGK